MKTIFHGLAFILLGSNAIIAQCCGGCNPIGGNTSQGTLPKYMVQVNTYYKHGYSEGYMQADHASDFKFVKNANSNYLGLQLAYGLTKRVTVDVDGGYYLNRTQNFEIQQYKFTLNGSGGSSVTLSGRCNIVNDTIHDFEFTMGAGLKLPWSRKPQIVDGVVLSEDVQPSNGAYGVVIKTFLLKEFDKADFRVFLINIVNINGKSLNNYQEGNTYITSLFVSKTLKNWTGIVQIRNEIRDFAYRNNQKVSSSGGYKFLFVPQINYSIRKKYNISAVYELPLYQNYYGIQLKDIYAFSINLNMRLGLNKKSNETCQKPN